jgi:hypothetical protein
MQVTTQTTQASTKNKRLSFAGDKLLNLNLKASMANLTNFEDEINYMNKIEQNERNMTDIYQHRRNLMKNEKEMLVKQLENKIELIEQSNNANLELRKKLIELEKNYEHLYLEFHKCKDMKAKYHNDIIKLRKENTKDFDTKLSHLNKQDKTIRLLKKELFLIINLLKLRIVNLDSLDEDKLIKGYLVDIEKNTIKYLQINKNEQALINCINYWQSMKELILSEEERKDKENFNKLNFNIK